VRRRPAEGSAEIRAALNNPSSWGLARGKAQLLALERKRRREAAEPAPRKRDDGPSEPYVG
jgi:hypothetical protein